MDRMTNQAPPDLLMEEDDRGQLIRRIGQLRAEITALLLQQDDLRLVQAKRIEAAYLRRFGALELKLCQVFLGCKRAKRRVELLRAAANRDQTPDLSAMETALDQEFHDARLELSEKARHVTQTIEPVSGGGSLLSASGLRALKQLYRQAIKALHPDLHPDQTEREARLFQSALRAYRFRDLETLRTIVQTLTAEKDSEPDREDLLRETERLRLTLRRLGRDLETMKASYPFNMRAFLEDPEKAAARKQELEERIRDLLQRKETYEQTAQTLVEEARLREQEDIL